MKKKEYGTHIMLIVYIDDFLHVATSDVAR
jgi:hypothetical protein